MEGWEAEDRERTEMDVEEMDGEREGALSSQHMSKIQENFLCFSYRRGYSAVTQ